MRTRTLIKGDNKRITYRMGIHDGQWAGYYWNQQRHPQSMGLPHCLQETFQIHFFFIPRLKTINPLIRSDNPL